MRNVLTTAAEVAGMGSAAYGFSCWSVPLALVFVGACLVATGYLLGRDPETRA